MKTTSLLKWLGIGMLVIMIYKAVINDLKKDNDEIAVGMEEMFIRLNAMDSIRQNIAELQRDLPQNFTNGNSLDEIKFDEKNKQVLYYFTYANLESSSKTEISNFQVEMNQQMINFWKNNESKLAFIDAGVSNKYLIFDKNKKEVFNFMIKPEDMK